MSLDVRPAGRVNTIFFQQRALCIILAVAVGAIYCTRACIFIKKLPCTYTTQARKTVSQFTLSAACSQPAAANVINKQLYSGCRKKMAVYITTSDSLRAEYQEATHLNENGAEV
jgi:hypothetical protein